ncbi:hypothetical protein SLS60_008194 [Paraconiothyrium brasiliense]|uniref:Uncharacterized protein n=1 Tax=Paraconiothyrium brasiliense TaxID=300254 RepID=A0ABR3R085_9PLEO
MSSTMETSGLDSPDDSAIDASQEDCNSSSRLEELRRFQELFVEHMPSTRNPKTYDHVSVLLLSFSTTTNMGGMQNMDVSEEVNHSRCRSHFDTNVWIFQVKQLEEVFRDGYKFQVKNRVIKCNKRSHLQAGLYLHEFGLEAEDKEHPLSIVYYAGHGWRSRDFQRKGVAGFDLTP